MKLSRRQEQQARHKFNQQREQIDSDDIQFATDKGHEKVERLEKKPPNPVKSLWQDLRTMVDMLSDYKKGVYKTVPWSSIAATTGAVVYFITPIDVIFDFIPVAGYLDDAFVIKLALDMARSDIQRYADWKQPENDESL